MKLRHVVVLVLFLVINALIFFALFGSGGAPKEEEKTTTSIQYYEAEKVNNRIHIDHIETYGEITGATSFNLSSEVQGKLLKGDILFKPGVKFRKGQVLCRVDNTDALYSLAARKSSFITLIANALPDIKVDFPDEFNKWLEYMNNLKLNQPLPELPAWKSNKEKVFLASRNIISEYFGIKSNENTIQKYTMIAPFNGMIQNTTASIHTNITPGMQLATLIETNNFELKAPIQLSEMHQVETGKEGLLYNNDGDEIGIAKIDRISDVVNQNTQSIDVYLKVIPYQDIYFYEGLYANLRLPTDSIPNSIELPRKAINEDSVFIFKDSALIKKQVNIERRKSNTIIVTGLNDGEMVVIDRVEKYVDSLKSAPIIK